MKNLLCPLALVAVFFLLCLSSVHAQCNIQQSQSVSQSQAAAIQAQALADVTNQLRAQQAAAVNPALNPNFVSSRAVTRSATAVAGNLPPSLAQLQSLSAVRSLPVVSAPPVLVPQPPVLIPQPVAATTSAVASVSGGNSQVCGSGGCGGGRARIFGGGGGRSVSRSVAITRTRG